MNEQCADAIKQWVLDTGRLIEDPLLFISKFSEQLIGNGIAIERLRIGFQTIHPQMAVWAFLWNRSTGNADIWFGKHGIIQSSDYLNSPIKKVVETRQPQRWRLTSLDAITDHRLLHDQAKLGGTDYLAVPTEFSDGSLNISSFTSDTPQGFTDSEIETLCEIVKAVSPIIEIHATRQIAVTLLNTYVGPRTGERIMKGAIQRGDGESLKAALWFSDLRDFTPLTENLPATDLLNMLNTYFETVAECVVACGGEILRFIGDAMLIVFPVENDSTEESVCQAAVKAATQAFSEIDNINNKRAETDQPPIRFGVGLHFGEVIYGNVGSSDRLDFTVMGAAVNRTARLESLTKELGHPLLLSAEMVELSGISSQDLGRHKMKGVAEPQPVFAPVTEHSGH